MTFIATKEFQLEISRGNVPGMTLVDRYGKNSSISTGTDPQDIWNGGGGYSGFPTGSAETMEIFSSDAADTSAGTGARTVRISNLLDGTGAEVADVEVTLNGTTPVSLGAGTYYRGGSRIKVLTAGTSGTNAGELTLRHTTTTANIFAVMPIGFGQTAIAAYTVPVGKTLYVDRISLQMARASGAAGSATMSVRARPHGGVFNCLTTPTISNSMGYFFSSNGFFKLDARTDIKLRCEEVSDNATIVTGDFNGILVDD